MKHKSNNKESGTVLIELSLVVIISLFIALIMLELGTAIRGYLVAQQLSREAANIVLRNCSDEYTIDKSRLRNPESSVGAGDRNSCLDEIQNNLTLFINGILNTAAPVGDNISLVLSVYRSDGNSLTTEFNYQLTNDGNRFELVPMNIGCGTGHLSLVAPRGGVGCGDSLVAATKTQLTNDINPSLTGVNTVVVAEVVYFPGFTINFFGEIFIPPTQTVNGVTINGLYDATII